ncbi:MAG: hypothetical protein PSV22_03780 [Pseudolabrys sp.]|nr:hypothetical protein [Pseudolabrys sp.]
MSDDVRKAPTVLTRDELYNQVWSTPLIRLGAQYGITGTGLAKICARLNVPCPPQGYWAKKAFGKPVSQDPLPEADAKTPLQVTISPAPEPSEPSQAQSEIQQQIERARADHAEITVAPRLTRPHPVIAQWLAEHERDKQKVARERDPHTRALMQPQPYTDIDRRQHRFLDALFKALEPLGFAIKSEPYQRVHFVFQGERIEYQLREKLKQIRRPLTENEKRWSINVERGWTPKLQPTGVLIFTIKTWLNNGMRTEWKDGSENPIENALPEIIATLSLAGPHLVKQREDRLAAEKRRWEEEQKRYEEQQRRELDQKRWMRFVEFARQRDEAARVRNFLEEFEAQPQPDDKFGGHSPDEWLAWAHHWLERFDPLAKEPGEIYAELARTR